MADGDNGYHGFPDLSGDNGESLSRKANQGANTKTVNSFNNQGTTSNSYNDNVVVSENSTSSETPSVNGITSTGKASSSASSAGAAGSSGASQDVSKVYEISKNIVENGPEDIEVHCPCSGV